MVKVRFLIGVRYDGQEQLFHFDGEMRNPAQYCIDRQWTRIDGVGACCERFTVYRNPYPIIVAIAEECPCDYGESWSREECEACGCHLCW